MGSETTTTLSTTEHLQSMAPTVDSGRVPMPVFWVYLDHDGKWRVRKEGGTAEAAFDSRDEAITFLRDLVDGLPSYRLFLEEADGRIIRQESRHEGHPVFRASTQSSEELTASTPTAEARHTASDTTLRRHLRWADQLSTAARASPSRMRLLADWFHGGQQ